MKKVFVIIGMLLSLGMFCACSKSDETTNVLEEQRSAKSEAELFAISANSVDVNVDSFIKEKLFNTYNLNPKDCFSIEKDMCYRIDSKEEFAAFYTGLDELPEIDFSKYTLLLGAKEYDNPDTDIENYKLVLTESEDGYILRLCCQHIGEGWVHTNEYPWLIYYYGLYPILEDKDIIVNLIYE